MLRRRVFLPPFAARSMVSVPGAGPLSQVGGVHGRAQVSEKLWRRKPLFRRGGEDVTFNSGAEAANLLVGEVKRRDGEQTTFVETYAGFVSTLAPLLDRMPKYAWIAKQIAEPERYIEFRCAWIDDMGVSRVNRGYRVQCSSALGPYEGPISFSPDVNTSMMKSMGFDTIMTNALVGGVGGACGGADFDPRNKSEAEIQRFCQSYMTELSKYIGPDVDQPLMGRGVGPREVGYLYGQYKRINTHVTKSGEGIFWGGNPAYPMAAGYGVVSFADHMLKDRGESLAGKRCLVTGCGKVAFAVAEMLVKRGAVPVTLSDRSGFVYEADGFTTASLETMKQVKRDRNENVGGYIISSARAAFGPLDKIYETAENVDFVFPCSHTNEITKDTAEQLLASGVAGVFEGAHRPCNYEARKAFKKQGAIFAPYRATLAGAALTSGTELTRNPILTGESLEGRIDVKMGSVYAEVKATATEFNAKGDLDVGANVAGFLKVASNMIAHGAV